MTKSGISTRTSQDTQDPQSHSHLRVNFSRSLVTRPTVPDRSFVAVPFSLGRMDRISDHRSSRCKRLENCVSSQLGTSSSNACRLTATARALFTSGSRAQSCVTDLHCRISAPNCRNLFGLYLHASDPTSLGISRNVESEKPPLNGQIIRLRTWKLVSRQSTKM